MRPGRALPFTSGPQSRSPLFTSTKLLVASLVTTVLISNLVSVDSRTSAARDGADNCALLTAYQPAEDGATHGTSCGSDLVAMFVPHGAVVSVVVIVVVDVVRISVVTINLISIDSLAVV